jgi:hypothetical protein
MVGAQWIRAGRSILADKDGRGAQQELALLAVAFFQFSTCNFFNLDILFFIISKRSCKHRLGMTCGVNQYHISKYEVVQSPVTSDEALSVFSDRNLSIS